MRILSSRLLPLLAALVIAAPGLGVAAPSCVGDCGEDGAVTVTELIKMVNIALGSADFTDCMRGDADNSGTITVTDVIAAVNNVLQGCREGATPTATATRTPGTSGSYVGDYHGGSPLGGVAVRFQVAADGAATGFLDFVGSGGAAAQTDGGGGDILASYPANGHADLSTGAYELSGSFAGQPFSFDGHLPATPESVGTLSVTFAGATFTGELMSGAAPPPPTPTPTPDCTSANLQMAFSGVSGDFNGIASNFVVERMNTAIEQKAPSYIPGLHEVYNEMFNGTECTQQGQRLRNIQISIFEVPGGLAGGQSLSVGTNAIIYYGEEGSGGDRVWSSSAGTVFIDSVVGSTVTLHVVGAAMDQPGGAGAGSFMLDVTGQVNNFTRQP